MLRPQHRRPTCRRRTAAAVFAAALLTLALAACAPWSASGVWPTGWFDLQGHRGTRGHRPENTLAAFDEALAIGVATLELDIALTRDGVPVILHDLRLNPAITRDAQGRWLDAPGPAVRSLTLAELQRHDVGRIRPGSRYAQTFAQQQPRDGERVPTLASLFDRVRARHADHVRFNIETKIDPREPDLTADPASLVRSILDVARAHGVQSRVTLQSFDWRTLAEVRRMAPAVPTVCLTARQPWLDNVGDPVWTAGLRLADHHGSVPRLVRAAGCDAWSPYFGDLDAALAAEARELGLRLVPWTVNEPADIERVLDLRPDGLISDYPDRVRRALSQRGIALPPAQR